ncbi:MAG TPA: hypothetical protein VG873_10460 [Burkholderiales bacterium]|nr:hypothetical protein [Burkholderiales bacterium]
MRIVEEKGTPYMNAANESKDVNRLSLPQTARALLGHYLGNRKVLAVLAIAIVGAGLALNWSWLVAAGIAPILLALAPCAAMCALGLCMSRMGGKSCSGDKDANAAPRNDTEKDGR